MRNVNSLHIDFSGLLGAIPQNTKALPSDLDMVLERNGRFLVAEWKREGEAISEGQRIMLRRLAKIKEFTVYLIQGYSEDKQIIISQFWQITADEKLKLLGSSLDDFLFLYRGWYAWADNQR